MKKFILIVMTVFICSTYVLLKPSMSSSETWPIDPPPELELTVNEDNSITIRTIYDDELPDESTLNIYKTDDNISPGSFEPWPIVYTWTFQPWHIGGSFNYPEQNAKKAEWIWYGSDRESELTNGRNSALRPGEYFAVIVTPYNDMVNYEISDRYYFEIPDLDANKETPASMGAETLTPTHTPTQNPTGDCLSFSSPTPTTMITPTPTTVITPIPIITPNPTGNCLSFSSSELSEDSNSGISAAKIVIYISLFAFILIAGIIIIVAVKKKNK